MFFSVFVKQKRTPQSQKTIFILKTVLFSIIRFLFLSSSNNEVSEKLCASSWNRFLVLL